MKPAAFEYDAPTELGEALALLSEHGDEAKVLAGGQSLVPLLALRLARFERLIDVNRVASLAGIEERDGELVIGATTRQAHIERDPLVRRHAPLLAESTRLIGHFQIRNRGTIGGSIAHADPAAEYPAIALTLDAAIDVAGPSGRRTIAAADFGDSAYVTVLEPDEMIVSVRVPVAPAASGYAIEEVARRQGDFALAGVAAAVTLAADASVSRARLVVFGVAERPLRLSAVEEQLVGSPGEGADVSEAIAAAVDVLEPPEDVQATSAYRRTVAGPLVHTAVRRAIARATQSIQS